MLLSKRTYQEVPILVDPFLKRWRVPHKELISPETSIGSFSVRFQLLMGEANLGECLEPFVKVVN